MLDKKVSFCMPARLGGWMWMDGLLDDCWEENGHGAECDVAAEEHELLIN